MAANLEILEATIDEKSDNGNKIHVIDFDVGQGDQYVQLLHVLSARQNGKPFAVKITAVADPKGGCQGRIMWKKQCCPPHVYAIINEFLDRAIRASYKAIRIR
ncbi:Scarecrow-like protein 8 [Morella rubra]|nr:Scarecrow-like protein 8 [Morella rubra]